MVTGLANHQAADVRLLAKAFRYMVKRAVEEQSKKDRAA
jgi:hypothetical protein